MLRKDKAIKNFKSQIIEQFSTLRTNIRFSYAGSEIKTIAITSCLPGEGKSTIISNLAVTMSKAGKKVILVDCDLKKPSLHKSFSLSNSQGLTNILVEDKYIDEVICKTKVQDLFLIPSGPIPPNSSELLGSKNIKDAIMELSERFDVVLIDTPPVLYISDALVMSSLVQGTIIISAYGKSDKNQLLSVKENIEKAGGKILGVVINKIPRKYNKSYSNYYNEK